MPRNYDLEKRLINFACKNIDIVERLPANRTGNYFAGQLMRAGNSPAFNYGEAQSAESRSDFIHKMRIVLKELKECRTALSIMSIKKMIEPAEIVQEQLEEGEELIAIVAASISTAEKNRASEEKNKRTLKRSTAPDNKSNHPPDP
jgi:four helix bundle protein